MILLEKAWAKMHGSYERLGGGHANKAFRDLTCAPAFDYPAGEPDLFAKLLEGHRREYAMAASIEGKTAPEEQQYLGLGLAAGHAYGVLAAAAVKDKNGNQV